MFLLAKQFQLGPYLFWIGVCLVLLIAASVGILWYRAKVLGKDSAATGAGLLDDLREMRQRGEISDEEFAAAKQAMAARMSGGSAAAPKPKAASERVAVPGFDLTGRPLPKPPDSDV